LASATLGSALLLSSVLASPAGAPQVVVVWAAMAAIAIMVLAQIQQPAVTDEPIGLNHAAVLRGLQALLFFQFCGGYWLPEILGVSASVDAGTATVSLASMSWLLASRRANDGFAAAGAVWVAIVMHGMWAAEQATSWTTLHSLDPAEQPSFQFAKVLLRSSLTFGLVVTASLVRLSGSKSGARFILACLPHALLLVAYTLFWARASGRLPLSVLAVPLRRFQ
jgi:hypothetical protein